MKISFFNTVQSRIIGLLGIFMTITFVVSVYTIGYSSKNSMMTEKGEKLLNIAEYLVNNLDKSYDSMLKEAGLEEESREVKIQFLNSKLSEITDEIASIYPGMGTGYYSLDLDAILTYGPSSEYSDTIGIAIKADHPGRIVMAENKPMVKRGTMVRGNIMNAMFPIERDGRVIGYVWANELTTDIENEYNNLTQNTVIMLTGFFVLALAASIIFSRHLARNITRIVAGVKNIKSNLQFRITGVKGELLDVANNINGMAEHIEKTNKEHDALVLAEAANAAQRDFLARMSHEIRTPMNGVLGMTRLAMQAESMDQSIEYMKKIQSSATILLGIINDILDFSKIESGKLEIEKDSFNIIDTIENIRELVKTRAEEKNLQLLIEVNGSVPQIIIGDSIKLSQILLNLLGNAVKFTNEGLVRLNVDAEKVDKRYKLIFTITDTGIGMTEEQIKRLFKPFSQADTSTVRKFGGTGLGLSISKALIELMDGAITFKSVPGEGSTFTFYIICEESSLSIEELNIDEKNNMITFPGKKILIAEDNEINQEIALAMLEEFGFRSVDIVSNGLEAVNAFLDKQYDFIFMDIRMPVMDGLESTRKIRLIEKERGLPPLPIVAMTANAMKEDRDATREAGMNDHISKPLDIDEIARSLKNNLK